MASLRARVMPAAPAPTIQTSHSSLLLELRLSRSIFIQKSPGFKIHSPPDRTRTLSRRPPAKVGRVNAVNMAEPPCLRNLRLPGFCTRCWRARLSSARRRAWRRADLRPTVQGPESPGLRIGRAHSSLSDRNVQPFARSMISHLMRDVNLSAWRIAKVLDLDRSTISG